MRTAARAAMLGRAGALAVSLLAAATAAAQFAPVPGQGYREVLAPKHPVSGALVVGLQLEGGGYGPTLHVRLPEAMADDTALRVEVDSPDGSFHGAGLFRGGVKAPQWVPLSLLAPAQPSQRPASVAPDELAVSVRQLSGQGVTVQRPLLASWQPQTELEAGALPPQRLRLMVNSRRGQIQVRGRADTPLHRCGRVKSASTLRFDTVCALPMSELEVMGPGLYRVTLLRRDGFASESTHVEVRL
jgi:hypothetical protein